MKSTCVALVLVLGLLGGTLPASIYVNDDAPADPGPRDPNLSDPNEDGSTQHPFDEIQEAIDVAQKGDTIVVRPGTYLTRDPWAYAELRFRGKSIRLVSEIPTSLDMADHTILRGVVIFDGIEDRNCLLQGFKIQNHNYGGILGNKTQATISHCIISGNGPCGATVLKDVRGQITNCVIVDNTTFHDCGVLPVASGCPTLLNCTIANNASGIAINCDDSPRISQIVIHNCVIWNNQDNQQIRISNTRQSTVIQIEYGLIQNWRTTFTGVAQNWTLLMDQDPDFVQPGYWEDTRVGTRGPATTTKTFVEGDYHLRSEGWRWSSRLVHESHWAYDASTSPGVDAGDPMDSLGEELERVPQDPEGQWGFNHAIDLGAYGGTKEGSLSPTWASPAPGAGAVDLHDYWPLGGVSSNRWYMGDPNGTQRHFRAWPTSGYGSFAVFTFETGNAPDWVTTAYGVYHYVDQTFYIVTDKAMLSLLPKVPQRFQAKYPQYLVVGATIQVPYDPFVKRTVEYRSVVVTRGTLAKVLEGTSMKPDQFLSGMWPDVIALCGIKEDGTTGDPIAVLARGFGPLLFAGQPVEWAFIRGEAFYAQGGQPPASRPATRD